MKESKSLIIAAFLAISFPICAAAQDHHATVQPDTVKWGPGPAAYPAGAQFAVLFGDPSKDGLYVVRLKVPAGYKIAPHTHPNDENVTVISGSFNIGTGDKSDQTRGTMVRAGGYSHVARAMSHYAWFTEDTVIQLHGRGPQGITYVNPSDDPRQH